MLNKYAEIKNKNTNYKNLINTIEYLLNEEFKEKLKEAQKDKEYLGRFVGFTGYGPFDDASQFWNMASNGFDNKKAEKYISKNAKIYSQIDELPVEPDIKEAVRSKVKQQLGKDDLVGVSFHKDSSVANNISRDNEFIDVINKNFVKLLKNEHINTSMNFSANLNLAKALGRVDILDMHMNKDGDIEAYILDTYDFNKGSTDKMVNRGYNAQIHNLLNNYYTLIKVIKKI